MKISVDVRPFVCQGCGQLQFMSDMESLQTPGNCDNINCQGDNILRAGKHQSVLIEVTKRAFNYFDKGERYKGKR